MTIVKAFETFTLDLSVVSLARYAQVIRYDENAFFGINSPDNRERACRKIWTKLERNQVARYLFQAQGMIEDILGYPLGQMWITEERHNYKHKIFTNKSWVQELGIKSTFLLSADVALVHTADPATFVPVATLEADTAVFHFYETLTDHELFPSKVTITSGNLVAEFPRARLVKESDQDNLETGHSYSDVSVTGPYIQSIDIKIIKTDTTNIGFLLRSPDLSCEPCEDELTDNICGYIYNHESGIVEITDPTVCKRSDILHLNYCAGRPVTTTAEDAIIHLAHALMPMTPCSGCDPLRLLWEQDKAIPDPMTKDRANAAFGVHDGAWRAWVYAHKNKHIRGMLR